MRLILLHPEVAFRDCDQCQAWLFDESGKKAVDPRTARPIPRPPTSRCPCRFPTSQCPKGTPEAQRSLTPQNERAYRHYLECRATGLFPDDPLVKHHAALIHGVEEHVERTRQERLIALLERLLEERT